MPLSNTYTITLLITEANTQTVIPSLYIEAWDKDMIFDDLVGSATTSNSGLAVFEFSEDFFAEKFFDRRPDLYFKIFYNSNLIASTEETVFWNIHSGISVITIQLPEGFVQTAPSSQQKKKPPVSPDTIAPLDTTSDYIVYGRVVMPDGTPVPGQDLYAVDIDLKGAALYQSAATKADLGADGFEFLGEITSDANGFYRIGFNASAYARAERGLADVVVYAIAADGSIRGRSHLVTKAEYNERNEVRNLPVVITWVDTRVEYEIVIGKLNPFLIDSGVQLYDLSKSADQVNFTASELDEDVIKIQVAVDAEVILHDANVYLGNGNLFHELLYGIGRQNIQLNWLNLYRVKDADLIAAINLSMSEKIIHNTFSTTDISSLLTTLHPIILARILRYSATAGGPTLDDVLAKALPTSALRTAFVEALRNFTGTDYSFFWGTIVPGIPGITPDEIRRLLLIQQLIVITGSFLPLVMALMDDKTIASITDLLGKTTADWATILAVSGVPDFITGNTLTDRVALYTKQLMDALHTTYPTQKIGAMVSAKQLTPDADIITGITNFLNTPHLAFDFASSNIDRFATQIADATAVTNNFDAVKTELKTVQRLLQVSTSPDTMAALHANNLTSAHSITSIPKSNFISSYAEALGGEQEAGNVYERATFISTRAGQNAMKLMEVSHGLMPALVASPADRQVAITKLQSQIPNYSQLFGSPDICECEECTSVYGATAYLVDLLRFLDAGNKNADTKTPLDMLLLRRPDLQYLPLTCENTNTVIPYIDLVNEVMEYYTCYGKLDAGAAHDTGGTTAEELRANQQNFNLQAYSILSQAVYPFSLPYHQPLDVIRTYSNYLKTSRSEVMQAMQKNSASAADVLAAQAESLDISEEEFIALTGTKFDGTAITTVPVYTYFGYTSDTDLDDYMAGTKTSDGIHEFLRRSGIQYTELIQLIETKFINPGQFVLDYLESLFANCALNSRDIYDRLNKINAGTLDPYSDNDIKASLVAAGISSADFTTWVKNNFNAFNGVITLYQSASLCDLDTTCLRTVANVYSPGTPKSGITDDTWSRIHRFIRLWRKLGLNIHETDLVLDILGDGDIKARTIASLAVLMGLQGTLKLQLSQLAAFWGNIEAYGDAPLYTKLFLNKAVMQFDGKFAPDKYGQYFSDTSQKLADHVPGILAAFRMSQQDLQAVLSVATVTDNNSLRLLSLTNDVLNLANLSVIYRHVVLSKALSLSTIDCCLLISLFGISPFSSWDMQKKTFVNISPATAANFCTIAANVKTAGFKPGMLQYIFNGATSSQMQGFNAANAVQTASDIKKSFAVISQNYPDTPLAPLTPDALKSDLLVSFDADAVTKLLNILQSQQTFTATMAAGATITIPAGYTKYTYNGATGIVSCTGIATAAEINYLKANITNSDFGQALDALFAGMNDYFKSVTSYSILVPSKPSITIPATLSIKYSYLPSGRLVSKGIMYYSELQALQALDAAVTGPFATAAGALYNAPANFISNNFSGIINAPADVAMLLNQTPYESASVADKLTLVYNRFAPLLRQKLRNDSIAQRLASLTGLTEAAATVLIAADLQALTVEVSQQGLTAEYFNGTDFTKPAAFTQTDSQVNFNWGSKTPDTRITGVPFGVRWSAFFSPPSSGDYTFVVNVQDADDAFNLYLNGVLQFSKASGSGSTTTAYAINVNAAALYNLTLEYITTGGNAGISLSWRTDATAEVVIGQNTWLPAGNINSFAGSAAKYYRAAQFINGFSLDENELAYFIKNNTDFGGIDFKQLTAANWRRINAYIQLRNTVPQGQAKLINIFAAANNLVSPPARVADIIPLIILATAWDVATLTDLVSWFGFAIADFKNEIALTKLNTAIQLAAKTGVSAKTLGQWGGTSSMFSDLNSVALLVKSILKAKYEEADWLTISAGLSDRIRENQKQALISYLLTRTELQQWGATDADGLFEYFLIDVQMGACMDTSRVVQANSSVQMFVSRCLLNLESHTSTGSEGVAPDAVSADRWQWMKQYRVWEANRKVFLYPENWLEPDLRDDSSSFFKELVSELVQNDITTDSVETAFRNYLSKLSDIAGMEVCGVYQEKDSNGLPLLLHVIARTHNSPYQYYYRTWSKMMTWSAWEKISVDIQSVDAGDNSGVHTIPVVWKNRLFIFWPEFMEKNRDVPLKNDNNQDASVTDLSTQPSSSMKPDKYMEVRMAWTERVNNKWSPKQSTKEFIEIDSKQVDQLKTYSVYPPTVTSPANHITFKTDIQADGLLVIYAYTNDAYLFSYKHDWIQWGYFTFIDIHARPQAVSSVAKVPVVNDSGNSYSNNYQKHESGWPLAYSGNSYLASSPDHSVIFSNNMLEKEFNLKDPFFYQDAKRAYFIRPFDTNAATQLKNPSNYAPPVIGILNDGFYTPPQSLTSNTEYYISPSQMKNVSVVQKTQQRKSVAAKKTTAALAVTKAAAASNTAAQPPATVNNSFGGDYAAWYTDNNAADTGFEFHTFYHPFASRFVTNLNINGMKGMLASDTDTASDAGAVFQDNYSPNFAQGLVKQAPSTEDYTPSQSYTFYKENVCFDLYGANSMYNWELFFHAPLYIAERLSNNGKYEDAMAWFHYIFDPTTDAAPLPGQSETSRYWKVLPFKYTPADNLDAWFESLSDGGDHTSDNALIAAWRDNPFKPFLIARSRPIAFMKNVVLKYVENLIAWGDSLFRQDTMETVNQALQVYVIANHILGPRPEYVPKRGTVKPQTYASLSGKLDGFSNALVELENVFPYTSQVPVGDSGSGTSLLGIGSALYFCIPGNDKLIGYWDTVADRLFKIRHCQDIDGVVRKLALFAPPIDPAMLIAAAAQGLSLGSILADLSSPPPLYRFSYMLQRANDFCGEVKALGGSLLAALEKKDGEELGRMRASHETQVLQLMVAIKEKQLQEARSNKDGLLKSRDSAAYKFAHYTGLLGQTSNALPAAPVVDADINADGTLPADTSITEVISGLEAALAPLDNSGVKIIAKEKEDLDKGLEGTVMQENASLMESMAGLANFFPSFSFNVDPFGIGSGLSFGGPNIGAAISSAAKVPQIVGSILAFQAAQAAKTASFIRREQDWTLQANLAAREIIQLDKQIVSAAIRMQVAEKELQNLQTQIANAQQVEDFLKSKFTAVELYQWMKEQLFAVYKQAYNMAYEMAKKAENCYRFELGNPLTNLIQYGYWDSTQQGLCSGEKLHLALRQLEKSYIEENRRELELAKNVSVILLNPLALQQLRTTGKCNITLPEELFDLDYQGHYFRRIKSVSLSIPCVAGPYTTVSCTLRLLKNDIRINTQLNSAGNYEHENDGGILIDDSRFRSNNVPVKAIAASAAQRDTGMFEFNFHDERYLPFEGAGVISQWQIELVADKALRQFDYSTLSDVILHINYTAREDTGLFKDSAIRHLKDFLKNQPMMRMFSVRHDFPTEWYRFLHPPVANNTQQIALTLQPDNFPFFTRGNALAVNQIDVLAQSIKAIDYQTAPSWADKTGKAVVLNDQDMQQNTVYGGMQTIIITGDYTNGTNTDSVSNINIFAPIAFPIKEKGAGDYKSLHVNPDELTDVFIVIHYTLV